MNGPMEAHMTLADAAERLSGIRRVLELDAMKFQREIDACKAAGMVLRVLDEERILDAEQCRDLIMDFRAQARELRQLRHRQRRKNRFNPASNSPPRQRSGRRRQS